MDSVSAMLHNLFSDSERERRSCTAHRTREVPSVIQTTPFMRTPSADRISFLNQYTCRSKKNSTFHSRALVFARSPNTSTIHLLPNASKVGLDEFLCDVFDVTAPPQCTPCMTLPSHGDAVSQLRPTLRHCTEPDQDLRKLSCRSVSFPTTTATERILGFDVSHCEL